MNLFALSGLLIGVSSLSLGVFVFLKNRKSKINQAFFLFAISVAVYGFGLYKIGLSTDPPEALFWWRITHIGVIFIPVFFLHFTYLFLGIKRKKITWFTYLIGLFFLFIDSTGFFIKDLRFVFSSFYYISNPSFLYSLFVFLWFSTVLYAHYELFKTLKKSSGLKQTQIKYFFLAMAIGFSGGSTGFLPVFGVDFYPILNFTVPFYPAIMAYAIVKKRLFDIKVVLTSLFVGLIAILLLVNVVVSETVFEYIWKSGLLATFLVFGWLLVKSVVKEIKYREEIRKAYEVEKRAHRELKKLDDAKTQFIMASQHHLRTPLTSMQGYLDLIFGGTYGKVPKKLKETLLKFQASTQRLTKVVNEFLDISQFQLGKEVVTLQPNVQIEPILKEIIEELRFEARAKGLYLRLQKPKKIPAIKADPEKLKVALFNIIDNGLKYTQEGGVTIKVETTDSNVRITVKDTGVGILEEEIRDLFARVFERSKEAQQLYATGRGIGLYIASHIIKAHQGEIWAESEGKGKGSTFYIELPIG